MVGRRIREPLPEPTHQVSWTAVYETKTWTDGYGKVVRIVDMPIERVQHLLAWLERRAGGLRSAEGWASCADEVQGQGWGDDPFDPSVTDRQWIRSRPLYRTLLARMRPPFAPPDPDSVIRLARCPRFRWPQRGCECMCHEHGGAHGHVGLPCPGKTVLVANRPPTISPVQEY